MFCLSYEVVTKKGNQRVIRYYPYMTRKMSSEILPKILKSIFKRFPNETIVYAKLIDITKELEVQ